MPNNVMDMITIGVTHRMNLIFLPAVGGMGVPGLEPRNVAYWDDIVPAEYERSR
jgi:hypothetical protein